MYLNIGTFQDENWIKVCNNSNNNDDTFSVSSLFSHIFHISKGEKTMYSYVTFMLNVRTLRATHSLCLSTHEWIEIYECEIF